MSLLESVDSQAREDIEKIKKEQYTQSARIKESEDCCTKRNEQLAAFEVTYGRRVDDLERRFTVCDDKHEAANQHRRKSDHEMTVISKTLQESLDVNKQIQETMAKLLTTVEKHAPTVERSSKTHATFDGMKGLLIYIACTSAAIIGVQHIIEFFSK